jgi:hypothetical protein
MVIKLGKNIGLLNYLWKNLGVADFRDENNLAYIQKPCRDVPWNVSTFLHSKIIRQFSNAKI